MPKKEDLVSFRKCKFCQSCLFYKKSHTKTYRNEGQKDLLDSLVSAAVLRLS